MVLRKRRQSSPRSSGPATETSSRTRLRSPILGWNRFVSTQQWGRSESQKKRWEFQRCTPMGLEELQTSNNPTANYYSMIFHTWSVWVFMFWTYCDHTVKHKLFRGSSEPKTQAAGWHFCALDLDSKACFHHTLPCTHPPELTCVVHL